MISGRERTLKYSRTAKGKAKRREWREKNRERWNSYSAKWREQNPEKAAENAKRWREYGKKFMAANPDKVQDSKQRYKRSEKGRASDRRFRERHKDSERERQRRWEVQNPEKSTAKHHRRRARMRNAPGHFTHLEWAALCEQFKHRCALCREKRKLTVDHIVPLIKGGTNWIANIQPLCLSCNSRKQAK
jgi:hypothetical protein